MNREIKIRVYHCKRQTQLENFSQQKISIYIYTIPNDSYGQNWQKTTYFYLETIKSKPKISGKLGHVVQIHVCHLV